MDVSKEVGKVEKKGGEKLLNIFEKLEMCMVDELYYVFVFGIVWWFVMWCYFLVKNVSLMLCLEF